MKLWQKISIICSIVLIVAMSLSNFFIFNQSKNELVAISVEQTQEKLLTIRSSFIQMMGYYSNPALRQATKHSLARYCFSQFADNSAVLIADGQIIYSLADIRPNEYLQSVGNDSISYLICNIDSRVVIIAGEEVFSSTEEFELYVIEDVTNTFYRIKRSVVISVFINFLTALIGIACIIFLSRHVTKPLMSLSVAARRFAEGNYDEQIAISAADEVGGLAADFNSMSVAIKKQIEELIKINEQRRLFIGAVSHEYKTPIATMLIHVDTLMNARMNQQAMMTSLQYIQNQCIWLEKITQKLLKLITLQSELHVEETPINGIFSAVLESVFAVLSKNNIELKIECGNELFCVDADLIVEMLIALIDNAMKASAFGSIIVLRASEHSIEVEDHGKGMPSSELERITEPFYVIDASRSKQNGGCGLGLAIVREIVKAHGAQLFFSSTEGLGTTVKIVFPDNNSLT